MATFGVFIDHRTKPSQRDAVRAVWLRHMAPAISANPGHLDYFYGLADDDNDSLLVFQRYASRAVAQAFLLTDAYKAYLREVEPLLLGPPTVRTAAIAWCKRDNSESK